MSPCYHTARATPAHRYPHPMTPRSDQPQKPANMDRSQGRFVR